MRIIEPMMIRTDKLDLYLESFYKFTGYHSKYTGSNMVIGEIKVLRKERLVQREIYASKKL